MPRRRESARAGAGVARHVVLRRRWLPAAVAAEDAAVHAHEACARGYGVTRAVQEGLHIAEGSDAQQRDRLRASLQDSDHGSNAVLLRGSLALAARALGPAPLPAVRPEGPLAPPGGQAKRHRHLRTASGRQEPAHDGGPGEVPLAVPVGGNHQPEVAAWLGEQVAQGPSVVDVVADVRIEDDGHLRHGQLQAKAFRAPV
mmetsp:Transcript_88070/g.273726  ORF Transcript_88070/g.273726 Transcript_88070/m.273726 type:complete len:200 (+) Transcript_88070:375-974(+)